MSDDQFISKQVAMQLANDLQIPIDGYHQHNQAINNYCAEIGSLPEAIVRCKDCIHRGIINVCPYTRYVSVGRKACRGTDTSSMPYDYETQLVIHCSAEDNDYCSKGERRADA